MKVALMVDNKEISREISLTREIQVFEINKGKIISKMKIDTTTVGGYEGLLYILGNEGVETVLCGSLKDEEKNDFVNYGLEVVSGARGNPSKTINSYIKYLNSQK